MISLARSIHLLSLVALLFSADLAAAAGKRYALVVGVKSYRPGQPLPDLPFTENDAVDLAKVLTAGGYQVTLMTQTLGREAGREVMAPLSDYVRDQLDAMLDNPNLKDEDVVIVALAGHGVQYELVEGTKKTPKFYFCPADADVGKLTSANEVTERNRLLDLGELYAALNQSKAGGKLLLVDACRNDPTKPSNTRSLASVTLPPLPPPPGGMAAFFSCSAHQRAFEDKDLQHGIFFHHVIEALGGAADTSTAKRAADGQITLAELSEYVSTSTYDFVRTKYQGAKQAPELKGEFRLSIPLIEVKKEQTLAKEFVSTATGMKLVLIPAGEFEMGSRLTPKELAAKFSQWKAEESFFEDERPPHRVKISQPFYLGQHEVTVGQFRKFVTDDGYQTEAESYGKGGYGFDEAKSEFKQDPKYTWKNPGFTQTDDHPVVNVSWNDTQKFCAWLSRKEGKTYRLPTEAEWEYACKAGTTTLWSNGDDPEATARIGNVADGTAKAKFSSWSAISARDGHVFTAPVGKFTANPFGLFDMHGNVNEWCADVYDAKLYGQRSGTTVDPQQTTGSNFRVLRGGSWNFNPQNTRSSIRPGSSPDYRYNDTGFRVSRTQ